MTSDALEALIHRTVEELGFELVDVRIAGPPRRRSVRVRMDLPDSRPGYGVTSDDCVRVARALRVELAAANDDPVDHLEVSSPGADRPVRRPGEWRRFRGRKVRFRSPLVDGRAEAEIVDVPDDQTVTLRVGGEDRTLAMSDISDATLVVEWSTRP